MEITYITPRLTFLNKEYIMIKKLNLMVIIWSLLYSTISLAENISNKTDIFPQEEVWHVVWIPNTSGPLTAIWTKRPRGEDFYGVWSNELRANLIINEGMVRFDGTARMNNGDNCPIWGLIREISYQESAFDGHFACARGDTGTITGSIRRSR